MQQYNEIKARHPDALLLFRVGDFYETFGADAIKTSRILDIVLTKRSNGSASEVELAGFPHHALDAYLPRLVRAGERVAICDQLEDPKLTKTIVKRGITELITPGLTVHDQVLKGRQNNFLCALHLGGGEQGIALCDISTGELFAAQGNHEYLEKLIQGFQPAEIIYAKGQRKTFADLYSGDKYAFALDDWIFKIPFARQSLLDHFGTASLKGFGLEEHQEAVIACGAIFHYLKETHHDRLQHITGIQRIHRKDYVWMDRFTMRNLELFRANAPDGKSLLEILDRCASPMGSRTLQRWLAMPLLDPKGIEERLDLTEAFYHHPETAEEAGELLAGIQDLERLAAKLSTVRIGPRELNQLKNAVLLANKLKSLCADLPAAKAKLAGLKPCLELIARIAGALEDEPAAQIQKGGVIREGFDADLDELRNLRANGKDQLRKIQEREMTATGIPSLKIAFNNVFGYYLEVRNTHKNKVPQTWIRKQTLVNAERYITEELKDYESKILGAEEKILALEQKLYQALLDELQTFVPDLQANARLLAAIDALLGFASLARQHNYCRPQISEADHFALKAARHPVIEQNLPRDLEYVSNDLALDREEQQIAMITGPNMSGKSALLRQTALIGLLAQIGSFVPAKAATWGLTDKIFVRVGASDNISQGESTFMVEMNETASILNNLSSRSLVILDEIGRGTSTYDGISIAWSIAEYLHEHPSRAKTLFATHYHELNEMAARFPRIRNFNISVKEVDDRIIFMRKLQEGGSAHSFGLHVAKMAGMPALVLDRAQQMLSQLEAQRSAGEKGSKTLPQGEMQLSFFQLDDPILEQIKGEIARLDIDTLTPVEALMKLNGIKKKIGL